VSSPAHHARTPAPILEDFSPAAGHEVDLVLHVPDRLAAIEVTAGQRAQRADTRSRAEVLGAPATRSVAHDARRLGPVNTRGREVEPLAPGVWAIPDWRQFGPGGLT